MHTRPRTLRYSPLGRSRKHASWARSPRAVLRARPLRAARVLARARVRRARAALWTQRWTLAIGGPTFLLRTRSGRSSPWPAYRRAGAPHPPPRLACAFEDLDELLGGLSARRCSLPH
jgi:hypothetical protein